MMTERDPADIPYSPESAGDPGSVPDEEAIVDTATTPPTLEQRVEALEAAMLTLAGRLNAHDTWKAQHEQHCTALHRASLDRMRGDKQPGTRHLKPSARTRVARGKRTLDRKPKRRR